MRKRNIENKAPGGKYDRRRMIAKKRGISYEDDLDDLQDDESEEDYEEEEDDEDEEPRRRKKSSKTRSEKKSHKGLITFLVILLILCAIPFCLVYAAVDYAYDRMTYKEIESVADEKVQENGVINILLIGNDSREDGEDGRSDAMILVSVSSKTGKILFTSLLRDIYVSIPGHDDNRLNAAYSIGGPELLMQTVEENFDIPVNRYVLVNFDAFAGVVDAVGGVDLDLTNDEVKWVNAYLNEYNLLHGQDIKTGYMDENASGNLHLNGPQALAYTRNRKIGTDFGRTERQRKVINAVIEALPSALMTNGPEVIDEFCGHLTTNLTKSECYMLALQGWKLKLYERSSGSIPLEGTWGDMRARGMAVLDIDFDKNKAYLQENLYKSE
ncbi:transcriptional attenuator, LytR family [Lachnospiraceae bacterium XPB1003]|nr:transcriptional attenuator, LytR family [Lachnospiraceae bacterium XPB1003]